jgi:hypothetical protein
LSRQFLLIKESNKSQPPRRLSKHDNSKANDDLLFPQPTSDQQQHSTPYFSTKITQREKTVDMKAPNEVGIGSSGNKDTVVSQRDMQVISSLALFST